MLFQSVTFPDTLLCIICRRASPKGTADGSQNPDPWDRFACLCCLRRLEMGGSSEGPVSPVTRSEWKIIVILTIRALIDRISPNR